jgi:putative tryptophan/tyrosine transport system substrate-binding protein
MVPLLLSIQTLRIRPAKRFAQRAAPHPSRTPCLQLRLPATYERANYVSDGGLSSLSPDLDEIYDYAIDLIDRILKGAKSADLPFEQPTRFHVSIKLKTAKALGITVPASVIVRADEVIE